MSAQPCPFCPIMLPEQPELWERIGYDFFGEPAMIGDIPSCGSCADVGEEHAQYYLDSLQAKHTPGEENMKQVLCYICRKRPASSERPYKDGQTVHVCIEPSCVRAYHKDVAPKPEPTQPPAEQRALFS